MPSPFPGMNPYFEQPDHWQDFHLEFLSALRRLLVPRLGGDSIVPMEFRLTAQDSERVPYLEVRDRQGRQLVTGIELLSPSDKRPGEDREHYLGKRRELFRGPAHLVEIDLLRGGPPMPSEERPGCDYSVLVSRARRRPAADFWPIRLRERLPIVPVPLRAGVDDARVDLQEVLHRAHDGPGYENHIYGGSPQPPLSAEDMAWAEGFVPRTS